MWSLQIQLSLKQVGNQGAQRDQLPHFFMCFHEVLLLFKHVRAYLTPGTCSYSFILHHRRNIIILFHMRKQRFRKIM